MSYSPTEPIPELTTARTGGRSARVIALGVVTVLVGVVYLGVSGRQSSTVPTAPAVAVTSPSVRPEPVEPQLDRIQAVRANPDGPVLYQYLGARLSLGGQATIAILDPVAEDEYRVSYRIPYSLVTSSANLNISTVMDTVSHNDFEVLGSWTFPLTVIDDTSPQIAVLAQRQPPDVRTLASPTFSRISRNGFRVSAIFDRRGDVGVLSVSVLVDPDATSVGSPAQDTYPSENYTVAVKTRAKTYASDASVTDASGQVRGQITLPQSLRKRQVSLVLSAIPMHDPLIGRVVVAAHTIRVPGRFDYGTFASYTDTGGDPNPGFAEISRSGYSLRISFAGDRGALVLSWQLVVNPRAAVPLAVVHHRLIGDDGLIGWPSALQPKS